MSQKQCIYCGSYAAIQREHVIPALWFAHRTYDADQQWIVDGCADCNRLAGVAVFFSIPEKAAYIKKRYMTKYKNILSIPHWTE